MARLALFRQRLNVEVPTLNDTRDGLSQLCRYSFALRRPDLDVVFTFHKCGSLQPRAAAVLGALARLIVSQNGRVKFDWDSCQPQVRAFLERNQLASQFGGRTIADPGHSIPYREDNSLDADALIDYLDANWLGRAGVTMSQALRGAVMGSALEIYLNSFGHSNSPIGVVTCGQRYPNKQHVRLTVVDLGVGIPVKVRAFLKRPTMPAEDAMRWAFERGNSTAGGLARGLGLYLLSSLVQVNKGRMSIISQDGRASATPEGITFQTHRQFFHGTLISVTLRSDGLRYILASEAKPTSANA